MNDERQDQIEAQWQAVNQELAGLGDGPEDAARRGKLLEQLDALEYEAGLLYFELRG